MPSVLVKLTLATIALKAKTTNRVKLYNSASLPSGKYSQSLNDLYSFLMVISSFLWLLLLYELS